MIPWRQIQKENFNKWKPLVDFLELDEENAREVLQKSSFPLNLPRRLAEKIDKNNLNDPILRQFVPLKDELIPSEGFCSDPVGDAPSQKTTKLLHKYTGRALLLCTSCCAMHCRFCFRQKFPYDTEQKLFNEELEAIAQDCTLEEIILSGGDPLSLSDRALEELLQALSGINHVQRIRFHTRFPIGIPERIDDSLLRLLAGIKTQIIFIIHVNHPRELDEDVTASLKKIQRLGIPVLNQAVLLKGVNDNLLTLKTLFEGLINHGILPYYLHQLDRVQGTAHFEVEEETGLSLIEELRTCLPGYAIPGYVREIAGEPSKTPVKIDKLIQIRSFSEYG
ncbi:MAG: KamA family radical SAM protein [Rhabdochlamydiaceae bacterium]|nr:KamA family radical SAM protein [Rhabdochlamydiaceae bacterium]